MWVRDIEDVSGGGEDLQAWVRGAGVCVSAAVSFGGGAGHGISSQCPRESRQPPPVMQECGGESEGRLS